MTALNCILKSTGETIDTKEQKRKSDKSEFNINDLIIDQF